MASQARQLHFLVFPLMAQGHMIPTVDIARLLAKRGVQITIVTTPHNAAHFKSFLARAIERLMDEGEENRDRRERARKLGERAKRAVEEGGSSYLNMTLFLEEIMQQKNHHHHQNGI